MAKRERIGPLPLSLPAQLQFNTGKMQLLEFRCGWAGLRAKLTELPYSLNGLASAIQFRWAHIQQFLQGSVRIQQIPRADAHRQSAGTQNELKHPKRFFLTGSVRNVTGQTTVFVRFAYFCVLPTSFGVLFANLWA